MDNIREVIRQLARSGPMASLVCVVDAVDRQARTVDCTPLDESAPLLGVNMQANQGSRWGMVAYPRVGSYVVVGFVAEGQAGVVLLTDDIESIEADTDTDTSRAMMDDSGITLSVGTDTTLCLTPDGITLNGGTLGGLAVCSKIRSNLEMLQRYVETLRSAIGSGLNAVGAGTAANGATGAGVFDSAMAGAPALNFEDMDNSKVKH